MKAALLFLVLAFVSRAHAIDEGDAFIFDGQVVEVAAVGANESGEPAASALLTNGLKVPTAVLGRMPKLTAEAIDAQNPRFILQQMRRDPSQRVARNQPSKPTLLVAQISKQYVNSKGQVMAYELAGNPEIVSAAHDFTTIPMPARDLMDTLRGKSAYTIQLRNAQTAMKIAQDALGDKNRYHDIIDIIEDMNAGINERAKAEFQGLADPTKIDAQVTEKVTEEAGIRR